jgi:hypothetical protein
VNARRLVSSAVALVALLALAALAASGRPLHVGGGGRGPSGTFVDFGWTTLLIVVVLWIAAVIWYALDQRRTALPVTQRSRWWLSIPLYVALSCLLLLVLYEAHLTPLRRPHGSAGGAGTNPNADLLAKHPKGATHTAQFRWEELVAIFAALALLGLYLRSRRSAAPRRLRELRRPRRAAVSAALDEAVDDLRNDPDTRRAIIAAYARTERALAAHGLPRRRAETPLEYLARTLAELDASADSIRRLTDLFELAKFSDHELEPQLKDDAIDALLAVRDELRAPEREPAIA